MNNKSALQIVEKAWWWYDKENSQPDKCHCYGETLSKAKASLFRDLKEVGYLDSFSDLFCGFIFRRAPEKDRVKMPIAPVLETLTEKQRHIIGHSNGNYSDNPGHRDYYCTTDGNPDCEQLVSIGLMKRGRTINAHKSSRYYILTESGALAALSDAVIERHRAERIMPWVPSLVEDAGMLSLASIEDNENLLQAIPENSLCRIYSAQWGYYWRANCAGYSSKSDAGAYAFKDAYMHTRHCGREKGIWYDFVAENKEGCAA